MFSQANDVLGTRRRGDQCRKQSHQDGRPVKAEVESILNFCKVPMTVLDKLLGDILRVGADVQVLEPPELRAKVQTALLDAVKRHV